MIKVNGDALEWTAGMTIRSVLKARKFLFPMLVVSIDGVHVPPDRYDTTPVPDGGDVWVVHMLSGG